MNKRIVVIIVVIALLFLFAYALFEPRDLFFPQKPFGS